MGRVNAQYNVAAADSVAVRIAGMMRRRMYARFLASTRVSADERILDVGATSDESYPSSNYLERWDPHRARIIALGIDDARHLEVLCQGVRVVRGDGRRLPFADASFDVVHSSAVLEHVGSRSAQRAFLAELLRVAKRAVFVTTPNRWFPVEFHSVLPLVHWLPPAGFRRVLLGLGLDELAREENLNLLGAGDLEALASALDARATVDSVRLLGWPSNLLLTLTKTPR